MVRVGRAQSEQVTCWILVWPEKLTRVLGRVRGAGPGRVIKTWMVLNTGLLIYIRHIALKKYETCQGLLY